MLVDEYQNRLSVNDGVNKTTPPGDYKQEIVSSGSRSC